MESAQVNALRFDLTKEKMMEMADELIAYGNKVFDDMVALDKASRTYANTIQPIAKFESNNIYKCINFGIKKSKGDIIYLLHSDDKIIHKILNEFTFNYKVEKKNIDVISIHKWLFSKVHKPLSIDINNKINELPLAIAGDWNPGIYDNQKRGLGNRAEDAYLSGLQAARHIDLKFKKYN